MAKANKRGDIREVRVIHIRRLRILEGVVFIRHLTGLALGKRDIFLCCRTKGCC